MATLTGDLTLALSLAMALLLGFAVVAPFIHKRW